MDFVIMKPTLRWGILGCGSVTELKSGPAYQQTPGFAVHAVMRRDATKAADYASRHQVPVWYSDADLLINDPNIDAVYIATPPDSHLFYALKVAAAGKICCVEKPMALNAQECAQMNAAFAAADVPLFVAYYRRSLPRFLQVKDWLDVGVIGSVRHVQWNFSRSPSPQDLTGAANWRTDPAQAGGGYFVDLASHGLDLLMYLLGDITQVQGQVLNQQQLYAAEDAVTAQWLFAPDAQGHVATGSGFWHFGTDGRRDAVEIIGSKGHIRFSVFQDEALHLTVNGATETLFVANPAHIQQYHVANIAAHLRGERPHPSVGLTAARATEVMAQILDSSNKKAG
jgi:predicted dehydrogenase